MADIPPAQTRDSAPAPRPIADILDRPPVQDGDLTLTIAKDLHFNMTGILHKFF